MYFSPVEEEEEEEEESLSALQPRPTAFARFQLSSLRGLTRPDPP